MHKQWNPWHGCHKCSPGCLHCYVYYLDKLRDKDASIVAKSKTNFYLPVQKDRKGKYKIPSNTELATCFTSDFFLEEADEWRQKAWEIIKERADIKFLIPTKRIDRFAKCIPDDWKEGYENVCIAVSCETQQKADERLPIFLNSKIKHRYIFASPLLENIDFSFYLKQNKIELVSVGGESYEGARVCDFDWVRNIKKTCDRYHVAFSFHQTGSNFRKDGKIYKINHNKEYEQAKKGLQELKKESRINK